MESFGHVITGEEDNGVNKLDGSNGMNKRASDMAKLAPLSKESKKTHLDLLDLKFDTINDDIIKL